MKKIFKKYKYSSETMRLSNMSYLNHLEIEMYKSIFITIGDLKHNKKLK